MTPIGRPAIDQQFTGDSMVHAIALSGGRARWYRNRYVRTRCVRIPVDPTSEPSLKRGTVSVTIFDDLHR